MNKRRAFLHALIAWPVVVTAAPRSSVVMLRLTPHEAQALSNILVKIGGDPVLSDRGHADTVRELLREQGYDYQWGNVWQDRDDGLYFSNYADYQHTFPSGRKPFRHDEHLRLLRRQQDG